MSEEKHLNGIDVGQLFATIENIKKNPELGLSHFRATNTWIHGTHGRATVKNFYAAGQEVESREARTFEIDEPPLLLGKDQGTNPVEYLLVALSGCLTTTLVAHASAKNIAIRGVRSRYEGDIDLRGFLGISEEVPVGYREIRVFFEIDADISEAQKEELIRMAQKYSPVFNSVAKPVPVSVQLEKEVSPVTA